MNDGIKTTSDLLSNPSFIRWAEGDADRAEASIWDDWCRKSEANRKLALKAQSEILGSITLREKPINAEYEWDHFFDNIHPEKRFIPSNRINGLPGVWWYRMAAVIVVAITTGLLAYYTGIQQEEQVNPGEVVWNQLETDYAESKKIALSDGSVIILGAHSTFTYPEGWVENGSIEVELKGEAYFSISKRSEDEPPFRVKTDDGIVEVLGTRFVVDNEGEQTRVVLEEGSVKVRRASSVYNEGEQEVQLKPNEMAEFGESVPAINIKQVNPDVYISWTENVLTLDSTSFRVLANRIQKSFGVKVKVNNPELYERSLTGELNLKTLDDLINNISEVLEIEVSKLDDTVIFG